MRNILGNGRTEWWGDNEVSRWTVNTQSTPCSSHSHHLRPPVRSFVRPRAATRSWPAAAAVAGSLVDDVRCTLSTHDWWQLTEHWPTLQAPLIDQTNQEEYGDRRRYKLSPERLASDTTVVCFWRWTVINISLTYLLPARRAGTVLRLGICGSVRPSVRPFLKMVQSTSTIQTTMFHVYACCASHCRLSCRNLNLNTLIYQMANKQMSDANI